MRDDDVCIAYRPIDSAAGTYGLEAIASPETSGTPVRHTTSTSSGRMAIMRSTRGEAVVRRRPQRHHDATQIALRPQTRVGHEVVEHGTDVTPRRSRPARVLRVERDSRDSAHELPGPRRPRGAGSALDVVTRNAVEPRDGDERQGNGRASAHDTRGSAAVRVEEASGRSKHSPRRRGNPAIRFPGHTTRAGRRGATRSGSSGTLPTRSRPRAQRSAAPTGRAA